MTRVRSARWHHHLKEEEIVKSRQARVLVQGLVETEFEQRALL